MLFELFGTRLKMATPSLLGGSCPVNQNVFCEHSNAISALGLPQDAKGHMPSLGDDKQHLPLPDHKPPLLTLTTLIITSSGHVHAQHARRGLSGVGVGGLCVHGVLALDHDEFRGERLLLYRMVLRLVFSRVTLNIGEWRRTSRLRGLTTRTLPPVSLYYIRGSFTQFIMMGVYLCAVV